MRTTIASIAIAATLPLALAQTSAAPSPIPTNHAPCTGNSAFCAGGPIILRCSDGTLQAGNCDDNLNEPPLGATCISYGPSLATCSAFGSSTTSSTTSPPTPGATCSGSQAICAGGPIILRCNGGTLQPGNCDDNLGEPPLGATCISYATSQAACSAFTASATANSTVVTTTKTVCPTGTGSGPGSTGGPGGGNGTTTTTGGGSGPGKSNTPTAPSSSPTFATGAAADFRPAAWNGGVVAVMMAGMAALMGGVMVL